MLYSVLKCPLLAAGKLMTVTLQIFSGLVIFAATIGIPAILLNLSHIENELASGASGDASAALSAIIVLMMLAILGACLLFLFARILGRIIDTVGLGDPFVPSNANRLRSMGWVALAFQLLAIPFAALNAFIGTQLPAAALHVDTDISFNGVMMAILLFILARVFRRGTEMREELEGTV